MRRLTHCVSPCVPGLLCHAPPGQRSNPAGGNRTRPPGRDGVSHHHVTKNRTCASPSVMALYCAWAPVASVSVPPLKAPRLRTWTTSTTPSPNRLAPNWSRMTQRLRGSPWWARSALGVSRCCCSFIYIDTPDPKNVLNGIGAAVRTRTKDIRRSPCSTTDTPRRDARAAPGRGAGAER